MFKKNIAIFVAFSLSLSAFAYTREDLENLSKDNLIQIILDLQGGGKSQCKSYNPIDGETGTILLVKKNPGYIDDGTLLYPNGNVFMLRSRGYTNDKTLSYPNGKTMKISNQYTNNGTIYWPNDQALYLKNEGYSNNGTIYRDNGDVWLVRSRGYSNDRQRFGLPVHKVTQDNFDVSARLTEDDSVNVVTTAKGDSWSLRIELLDGRVKVTECFDK